MSTVTLRVIVAWLAKAGTLLVVVVVARPPGVPDQLKEDGVMGALADNPELIALPTYSHGSLPVAIPSVQRLRSPFSRPVRCLIDTG